MKTLPAFRPIASLLLCAVLVGGIPPAVAGPAAKSATLPAPTPEQIAWADAGIGIFVHWGPQTIQGREIDNLSIPAEKIVPDRFDAAKIVAAAKSANAGYLVFVAKHNGGYCTWPTATTPYSIKASPWKDGKGDMVGDIASACKAQGLKFGVYLCPADRFNHVKDRNIAEDPAKQPEADARYRAQVEEILKNYGPVFEMWFDGGGSATPLDDLFDKYAPGAVQFNSRRPGGIRWVGTEHGFAPYPCWNTARLKPGDPIVSEKAMDVNGNVWCPAECDVSILRPHWFWRKNIANGVLSTDALMEIYYLSVGHGANLLLNIAPDDHGEVPALQVRRLKEFGDEVNARFSQPLATLPTPDGGALRIGAGQSLTLDLGGAKSVDHLRLREDTRTGEHVRKFSVKARRGDTWVTVTSGTQIGTRQIIPFEVVTTTALRLDIEASEGDAGIREFSAFFVNRPVPKRAFRR